MKLWIKTQTVVITLAIIYILFIFNDGAIGKPFIEALFGLGIEWIQSIFSNLWSSILQSFVDGALHQ